MMGVIKFLSNKVRTGITYLIRLVIGHDCFAPSKSFFELRVVRLSFGFCSAIALASTIIIIKTSNLAMDLSFIGFNHAITVFKFPIAAIAVLIPLIAVLAANHRSVQTREAMRLTESQNKFANYYKHLEEFQKHVGSVSEHEQFSIHARAIYPICFKDRSFNLSKDVVENLARIVDKIAQSETQMLSDERDIKIQGIQGLAGALEEIKDLFQSNIKYTPKAERNTVNRASNVRSRSESEHLATTLILYLSVVQHIVFFDLNFPQIFEESIRLLRRFQNTPVILP